MSTLLVSLQAQADALDARLSSITATSVSANGVNRQNPDWIALSNQRIKIAQLIDRLSGNSPMLVRGVVNGLGHGIA